MGLVNSSQIKIVKRIVKKVLLAITDARVSITLLIIDVLKPNLLLRIDWMRRYNVKLSFRKKILIFESKD